MAKSGSGDIYDLEFRCVDDDAWYNARLILQGEELTVKFQNFPAVSYNAGDFTTFEDVDYFCQRIRPLSEQLQDNECYRIVEGMEVCACFAARDGDLRFFDAIVDAVDYKDHSYEKNEEECLCNFLLAWLHGPNEGNLSSTSIADICLVRSGLPPDATVTSFSNLAKEKIINSACKLGSVSEVLSSGTCPTGKRKSTMQDGIQELEHTRKFLGSVQTKEGRAGIYGQQSDEDRDMGGESLSRSSNGGESCNGKKIEETGDQHYVIIDNLEKGSSSNSIAKFIHEQTSISAQVCVFPSLSTESFTRGAILLDSKEKLEHIYKFLINPNHIIISSTGRPWVIPEKNLKRRNFIMTSGSLLPKSQRQLIENKLEVVHLGTEEYSRAERQRTLFLDFLDHLGRLHERLSADQKKSSWPSHAL